MDDVYYWRYLTTETFEVLNAIITPTKLVYNKVSGEMISTLEHGKLNCDVTQGYCQTPNGWTYLFEKINKTCPDLEKMLKSNVTAYIHEGDDEDTYITVPEIGLSFDSIETCNNRTKECHGQEYGLIRCTPTHFIIAAKDANG